MGRRGAVRAAAGGHVPARADEAQGGGTGAPAADVPPRAAGGDAGEMADHRGDGAGLCRVDLRPALCRAAVLPHLRPPRTHHRREPAAEQQYPGDRCRDPRSGSPAWHAGRGGVLDHPRRTLGPPVPAVARFRDACALYWAIGGHHQGTRGAQCPARRGQCLCRHHPRRRDLPQIHRAWAAGGQAGAIPRFRPRSGRGARTGARAGGGDGGR